MSNLYGEKHRHYQNRFATESLADRLEELIVKEVFEEEEKAFLEAQNMFFLSTIDQSGAPTVSYKGGAPGFVKVVDEKTLIFPSYNGNGMFYSMGNIDHEPRVGLLFINFETPHRIRVHGTAKVSEDDPLLSEFKEAELIVRVTLSKLWVNCPRYIHKMQQTEQSHYVPEAGRETPFAGWKRLDLVEDVLPPEDRKRLPEEGGTITIDEWMENVQKGKG